MSNKDDLVQGLNESLGELERALDGIESSRYQEAWFGWWGVRQILIHMIELQRAAAEGLNRIGRGERSGVAETDSAEWNEEQVHRNAHLSDADLWRLFKEGRPALFDAIATLPDERFEEGRTARRIIQNTVRHERSHANDILGWRQGAAQAATPGG